MEIHGLSNNTTENLKQKNIISWVPVVQATDESFGPTQRKCIALGRGLHGVWHPIHRRVIKECSIAFNRDWVNN